MVVTSLKDKQDTLRLTKAIELLPLTQAYEKVLTNASGLVSFEPEREVHSRKGVRLANGIIEVQPQKQLSFLLCNKSRVVKRLPKHSVVGYVTRFHDPIHQTGKQTLPAFAEVLHVAEPVPPLTSVTIPTNDTVPDLGNATKKDVKDMKPRLDWNESAELSQIQDEQLRADI